MVFIEQHRFWYLLLTEYSEGGEKKERWLTQAPEDPLEEDEEPLESESRVVISRKNPHLNLESLRNKQPRLVIPPVTLIKSNRLATRIPLAKSKSNDWSLFRRLRSKTTKKIRLAPFYDEQKLGTYIKTNHSSLLFISIHVGLYCLNEIQRKPHCCSIPYRRTCY